MKSSIDSVYLFSPSGALQQPLQLERAVEQLRGLGLAVQVDKAASKRWQRFAGSDSERLAGLYRAANSSAQLLLASRGGYGLTRILPDIDFSQLPSKRWCGHSDLTALFVPLARQRGQAVYFGPMACYDFGRESLNAGMLEQFQAVLQGNSAPVSFAAQGFAASGAVKTLQLQGKLWGGNLSMFCALLATPYFYLPKNTLLFFEDINEHPYQVERMLTQLHHAGVFKHCQGLLLGEFLDYQLSDHDHGFDLTQVVKWLAKQTQLPVVTGLPFGHGPSKLMLRYGATASLQLSRGRATLKQS